YCEPVRKALRRLARLRTTADWREYFEDGDARYLSVNPSNLFGELGTLEVRLHNGTFEAAKILTWLSLWMRIVEGVGRGIETDRDRASVAKLPLCSGPEGDIMELARRLNIGAAVRERLAARHRDVLTGS